MYPMTRELNYYATPCNTQPDGRVIPYGLGCEFHPDCFTYPYEDCVEEHLRNLKKYAMQKAE